MTSCRRDPPDGVGRHVHCSSKLYNDIQHTITSRSNNQVIQSQAPLEALRNSLTRVSSLSRIYICYNNFWFISSIKNPWFSLFSLPNNNRSYLQIASAIISRPTNDTTIHEISHNQDHTSHYFNNTLLPTVRPSGAGFYASPSCFWSGLPKSDHTSTPPDERLYKWATHVV